LRARRIRLRQQSIRPAKIGIMAETALNLWLIPYEGRNASRMQAQLLPIPGQ
jgi:hypothetical protein